MMTKRCPKELTYPKSELILEEVGNKEAVGVPLDPVPAGVRDHDGGDRRRPG